MRLKPIDTLKIIAGLLILAFLFGQVGFEKIAASFSRLDILYLVPYLVLHVLSFVTGTANMKLLTDVFHKIKYGSMFRYNIIAWSVGQFVPAKLGEFSSIYYLKKEGMKVSHAVAATMLDKIITTVVVAWIAVVGAAYYFGADVAVFSILYLALLLIGYLIATSHAIISIKNFIFRGPLKRFTEFVDVTLQYAREQKAVLFINSIITFFKWLLISVGGYFLFLGFGVRASFIDVLFIGAIGTMATLIPITFAGLGIREGVTVFLFTKVGMPAEVALSVALIQLIINYATAVGVLALVKVK